MTDFCSLRVLDKNDNNERVIESIKIRCPDRVIVMKEEHLESILFGLLVIGKEYRKD